MRRAFSSAAKAVKSHINGNPELDTTINNLMRVRHVAPDSVYVGTKAAARRLISELQPHLTNDRPLLEINPGFGFLTRELLNLDISKIKLFESSKHYETYLKELKKRYPQRLDYKITNFFSMWKNSFMDQLDSGERIDKMFEGILIKPWGKDLSVTIIGCLPSTRFIQHLNMSMIFQETIVKIGRPELFLLILPKNYLCFDTSERGKAFYSYRSNPVLFNILFNHKIVTKLPRSDYIPIQSLTSDKTHSKKKSEILTEERENMYLVHITGKENIPTKTEHLPLLWYFCKHHLRSKENRIIPKLEEWIPGCGIWLITGQDPPGTNVEIGPNESDEPLPHITIFTQFRDLSHQQILTLFKKFISWPEFEQSPFREIVDNHLNKSLASYDPDTKIDIEQEDEPHELR